MEWEGTSDVDMTLTRVFVLGLLAIAMVLVALTVVGMLIPGGSRILP